MREKICNLLDKESYTPSDFVFYKEFRSLLNSGEIRAAYKEAGQWKVCSWVKKGILLGFKMGIVRKIDLTETRKFFDKDTLPEKKISLSDKIRIIPGGSAIRDGCFIAPSVVVMPPSYINIGAYIDSSSLIDSHVLVGTCAQIGKNVHLSAGSMIGGVLEPIGNRPVIVEDNAFIGGNTGLYEGVTVLTNAVVAAGVVLTSATPLYDAVNDRFIEKGADNCLVVPEGAVVVQGSRKLKMNHDFSVYCGIIIKYRDSKTDSSLNLEDLLREK